MSARSAATATVFGVSLALGGCFQEPDTMERADASGGTDAGSTVGTQGDESTTTASTSGDAGSDSVGDAGPTSAADASGGDDTSSTTGPETGSDESSTGEVMLVTVDELFAGDLVITEVMGNPGCFDDGCEWLEIYNPTSNAVNLLGMQVLDESHNQSFVDSAVIVDPHDFVVLARPPEDWFYAFEFDGMYSGRNTAFTNSTPDRAIIRNNSVELDRTPLLSFDQGSHSWVVLEEYMDAVGNDDEDHWCLSGDPLATTTPGSEFGTPHTGTGTCWLAL